MRFNYPPIKIVISDDHELFREGLTNVINKKSKGRIEIVGEAGNGAKLVKLVEQKKPDVVVTDIMMPEMNGFDACRAITKKFPDIGVIALSMLEDTEAFYDMLEAGAKGYLVKNSPAPEIVDAIETVHKGEMYYCSVSSKSLIRKIGNSVHNRFKLSNTIQFSDTERNIVKAICKQKTTKEIAHELHLSEKTIEQYSKKIKEKTDAKNLVGIALFAIKNKIVDMKDI
jgi:DNA-binding NarL/FixJ family response regulator